MAKLSYANFSQHVNLFKENVHPVSDSGIRTHNLLIISLLL